MRHYQFSEFSGLNAIQKGITGSIYSTNESFILKEFNMTRNHTRSFWKEILFLNKLKNEPNIVKLHGICFHEDKQYLVLEQLDYDMYSVIEKGVTNHIRLKAETLKDVTRNILVILKMVHSYGILHGDIKNENIMISKDGDMKLIDFGLADFYGISPNVKFLTTQTGTSTTVAPDISVAKQYISSNKKSYKSDIYSTAVALVQVVALNTNRVYTIFNGINYSIKSGTNGININSIIRRYANEDFFDLMVCMLKTNSHDRYSEYQALSSSYFLEAKTELKTELKKEVKKEDTNSDEYYDLQKDYIDDIHNRYVDEVIEFSYPINKSIIKELHNSTGESKEALINVIIYARRNGQYNDCVLFMYNCIFDVDEDTIDNDAINTENFKSIVNYDFHPVWTHVAYAYYKGLINKDQINYVYNKIIEELVITDQHYISIWGITMNIIEQMQFSQDH